MLTLTDAPVRKRLFTVDEYYRMAIVSTQSPAHLDAQTEPEPDLMLLRPRDDFYASAHPEPADVLLLVEVADSSLAYDRDVKSVLYAEAGIAEFWLIDLAGERVVAYRQPTTDCYRQITVFLRGEQIAPQAFPDLLLPVDDILGSQQQPATRKQ